MLILLLAFAALGTWCAALWGGMLALCTAVTYFTDCPARDTRGCTHH